MDDRYRDGSRFERVGSYSRAVRRGSTIVVSGTAAIGEDGQALYEGDVYWQTREALSRALLAIDALGGTRDDVVRTRLLLATGADWREAVRAHGELLSGVDPANTTMFVTGFPPPGALVEVELDALVAEPLS